MKSAGTSPYLVCCVADDRDASASIADTFSDDVFETVTAWSLDDVTELLVAEDVDCVVTSYDLGGDEGYALLRQVRRSWPRLPVVLYGDIHPDDVPGSARVTSSAFVSHRTNADPRDRLRRVTRSVIEAERSSAVRSTGEYVEFGDDLVHASVVLDRIFDSFPAHIYVKDAEGRHVAVSRSLIDDPDDVLNDRDTELEFVTESAGREAYVDDMSVIEDGRPMLDKVEFVAERGQWDLTSKVPLYGEDDDAPIGLVGITHDITSQKRAEQELERQNARLQEFANLVSHDLRNPLSVARGHLEAADPGSDSVLEHHEEIEWALDRMDELIEEVLLMARHGRTVLEYESVDLASAATEARRSMDAPALDLTVEPIDPIKADDVRVRRLLENVFYNAVEHGISEESDRIVVRVGRIEGRSGFFVEDDGVGVPAAERDEILDAGYTTADEGTGFGLAIVREIVDAHGWEIDVTESESGGTRFEVVGVAFTTDSLSDGDAGDRPT